MKTGEGKRLARERSERVAVFKRWWEEEMEAVGVGVAAAAVAAAEGEAGGAGDGDVGMGDEGLGSGMGDEGLGSGMGDEGLGSGMGDEGLGSGMGGGTVRNETAPLDEDPGRQLRGMGMEPMDDTGDVGSGSSRDSSSSDSA